MAEKRRNPRRVSAWLDLLHVGVGGAVIVLSVLAFLDPEEHLLFFPLIFFLGAIMSLTNGIVLLRTAGRDTTKRWHGIGAFAAGLLCVLLGGVSCVVML